MTNEKIDVYQSVTNKIIADLENGVRSWLKPWNAEHAAGKITRPLRHNGVPYNGVNVIMLWMEAVSKGYTAPIWATFKQARDLGGCVRKGEKGTMIVHANTLTKTEKDEKTGEDAEKQISYLKQYFVFNVEQIDGLPAHFYAKAEPPQISETQRIEHIEQFFKDTGARIEHGGNRAFFRPSTDHIQMPPFEFFKDPESYYATLAHEATHWTGSDKRLARDLEGRFGSQKYAAEELIAEIGSAFLCADLGITPEVREDHAAYLKSWLDVMKADKRAIFTAAAHAQRATEFLHNRQPTPEPEPDRPTTERAINHEKKLAS